MLAINDLHAGIDGNEILKGVNLVINPGEVHAIMGPNGSGKSTLASVLAGKKEYEVTKGSVEFQSQSLLGMPVEKRAQQGIFLGFQYPVEIPGVSNASFLRTAVNTKRKAQGVDPLDAVDFLTIAKEKMELLDMDQDFLYRSLNEGFSGGEKKRNEIFQMLLLDPQLAILDEIDSGLDIDAMKVVAQGVNSLRAEDKSILIVTHYQRLLDYIEPDYVHVFSGGKIVETGDKSLAHKLEQQGYGWINKEPQS